MGGGARGGWLCCRQTPFQPHRPPQHRQLRALLPHGCVRLWQGLAACAHCVLPLAVLLASFLLCQSNTAHFCAPALPANTPPFCPVQASSWPAAATAGRCCCGSPWTSPPQPPGASKAPAHPRPRRRPSQEMRSGVNPRRSCAACSRAWTRRGPGPLAPPAAPPALSRRRLLAARRRCCS